MAPFEKDETLGLVETQNCDTHIPKLSEMFEISKENFLLSIDESNREDEMLFFIKPYQSPTAH